MDIREALTFDDVLLEPAKSEIHPSQADTRTRLTRSIERAADLQRLQAKVSEPRSGPRA